jgi:hypothetical protein
VIKINFSSIPIAEYLQWTALIWTGLLSFINFHRRESLSWFFTGIFFWALFLNNFWRFDNTLGSWLVAEKANWLKQIDNTLPIMRIHQNATVWIMAVFYIILFILLIKVLAQVAYRKFTFMLGFCGFVIYVIGFSWWLYWALHTSGSIPPETIENIRQVLLTTGNLFFIGSFILALKR